MMCIGCSSIGPLDSSSDEPAFYSYVNAEGRTVFVSDPSRVPPGTDAEPFDVSHVELNEELGRDLNEAVHAEHARLVATDWCKEERRAADESALKRIWDEQPHWVGIGGLLLLLALTAPALARRVGAPKWTRVLAFIVPLLLLLGVLTQTIGDATETLRRARANAPACDEDALSDASPSEAFDLVQRLRRAYDRREAQIDAVLESAR